MAPKKVKKNSTAGGSGGVVMVGRQKKMSIHEWKAGHCYTAQFAGF